MRVAHPAGKARAARWSGDWLYAVALAVAVFLILVSGTAVAEVREIRGFVLTVSDLDRSVAFYEKALGFSKTGERVTADREYDHVCRGFRHAAAHRDALAG